jgi:hypothetical protein
MSQSEKRKDKRIFSIIELLFLGLALPMPFLVFLITSLLGSQIPTGKTLYFVYFAYFVLLLICLHYVFFAINWWLFQNDSIHCKRLPRYVEYIYALVLCIGLLQIFFSEQRIIRYLSMAGVPIHRLAEEAQSIAVTYLNRQCVSGDFEFFTLDYCMKLHEFSRQSDPLDFIKSTLSKDSDFLNQAIGRTYLPKVGATPVFSPIKNIINAIMSYDYYSQASNRKSHSDELGWIFILILPLGVSLRVVKTSLELYGEQVCNAIKVRYS